MDARHDVTDLVVAWRNGDHGALAQLIHYARRYQADKRGGGRAHLPLEEATLLVDERADMLIALDEALERLAAMDARLGRVVERRYFAGLSDEETAEVLGVTSRTVRR